MNKNPTSKSPILIKKGIQFLERKIKRVIDALRAKSSRTRAKRRNENLGENRDISAI